MKSAGESILTINGGSSSIRFAVYETGQALRRRLDGKIDRIGLSGTNLSVSDPAGKPQTPRRLVAADPLTAVGFLLDWLEAQPVFASIKAAGHRVVHGMKHSEPQRVRKRICDGLGFLGIELDHRRNAKNAPLISPDAGRVKVRVIRTDEELMIARSVIRVLKLGSIRET